MNIFRRIAEGGKKIPQAPYERRSVILSNYISLVLFFAVVILIIVRQVLFNLVPDFKILLAAPVFLSPILLNYLGYYKICKIYLSWLPTIVIFSIYYLEYRTRVHIYSASYDSLRIYLLGVSCIPLIMLSATRKKEFIIGISLPMFSLVFCDQLLDLLEVGYHFKGTSDDGYLKNNIRTIVSYLILSGSCISLKILLERTNEEKDRLLLLLAEKNRKEQIISDDLLKEASARLTLATQSAGIGIWEWDLMTEKIIWDEQMYLLFGIEKNSDDKISWRNFVHPEDFDFLMLQIEKTIAGNQNLDCEFRIIKKDGEINYLYSFGKVHYENNKPGRISGVCRDITEKKLADEQLQQIEANLYATINNTIYYIWSVNLNFEVVNVNKPFRQYLIDEYGLENVEGLAINNEYFINAGVEELSKNWLATYKRALTGESFELEETRKGKIFKYALNPIIENAMVTGVSVFAEDNTEFKKKELELFEANKKIGELKLAALRAAMNPHFIFNSLNSIQYFIMENDQRNATKYLSTFSKLIRGILNNSINNKIKLADELEQLQYYINLEQLRFENKFDFVLTTDTDIDIENIEIPSMLIQPYVENAILHGLYNKAGRGMLNIHVSEEGNNVIFEIEDDGIGREASAKIRKNNLPLHKSLGTSITEERLKIINNQIDVSFEITDKYEGGEPTGTKIKIYITEI